MNKVTHIFERVIYLPSKALGIIGMCVIIPMMLLTTADVFLRTAVNNPILGAHEISGFMMVILVFMGLAYTLIEKRHIVVDLVAARLPHGVKAITESMGYLFSTITFFLITWQSTIFAIEKWQQGVKVATIDLLIYPFVFVAALGAGLLCLALMANFLRSLTYRRKK